MSHESTEGRERTFNVGAAQAHRHLLHQRMTGRHFVHYKGGIYIVVMISNDEVTGETLITYRSLETGDVWTRTHRAFTEYVNPTRQNPDGVPRFVPVGEEGP